VLFSSLNFSNFSNILTDWFTVLIISILVLPFLGLPVVRFPGAQGIWMGFPEGSWDFLESLVLKPLGEIPGGLKASRKFDREN